MNPPAQKHFHQLHADEVLRLLEVNLQTGLAGDEVKRRQVRFGPPRVTPARVMPAWLKFLQQFNQPLVYILLAASGITAFLGVVFINTIVGFLQEAKPEKAIESLARKVATCLSLTEIV